MIGFLDGPKLRGALVAACDGVQGWRVELNRINVFPVPDGDTGTNLALTTASIAEQLRSNRAESVGEVAWAAAEAGVLGARGNCGMILSHFLLGLSNAIGERVRLTVEEFVPALRAAVEHVYASLERPVEGTMLTVMRAIADEAEAAQLARTSDFPELLRRMVGRARESLARTTELLPALRAAGVVDAGAKGFVHLLEGMAAYVSGEPVPAASDAASAEPVPLAAGTAEYPAESERYRYCTEALVRGAALPAAESVRGELRERGDSMVVIRTGELLKVHIHTDEPEGVFDYLRTLGRLAAHKAEDMRAQHAAAAVAASGHLQLVRRPVVVVTDSAADLPLDTVRQHGIHVVPLNLIFGSQSLRDGVDISAREFAARLQEGAHPTTSQPTPAAFLDAYSRAAGDGNAIVVVTLGSTLSGTFASAEAAARRWRAEGGGEDSVPVRLVDSLGASLTQGMLALRAAELAEDGWTPERIAPELARVRRQSGILFTLETYDRLIASGRVGRARALLGTLLSIRPILGIDTEGQVVPLARVRGARNVLPRAMEILEAAIPAGVRRLKLGVIHVAAPEMADEVAAELRSRFGADRDLFISPATPVIATHTGPGTWGVAYQVED
jgi:DegV family protein with EDD domain